MVRKGTGRVHTAGADATHFSNTRGGIVVEKALFEGMREDAINVQSTCLGVREVVDSHTLKCKYMHRQAVGFEVFLPGEKIRFINGPTLEMCIRDRRGSKRSICSTSLRFFSPPEKRESQHHFTHAHGMHI